MIAMVSLWVLGKSKTNAGWHVLTLAIGFCTVIPWVQYACGLNTSFGNAWINSIYMLGCLCVMKVGEKWETDTPGQSYDFIFIAVMVATIVSIGIQLRQWAGLEPIGFWTIRSITNSRYYANLAQPNELASLELLGLVGCSWGFYRQKLSASIAIILSSFILIGIVLTESRTAMLNMILLVMMVILFRQKLPSKKYLWVVISLTCYFFAITLLIPMLNNGNDSGIPELRAPAVSERLLAWRIFINASLEQPVWGFGWGQLTRAYFLLVGNYPDRSGLFSQSHNLLLDIILWNGYPIGLLLISVLIWWTWKVITSIHNFHQIHALAFVMVLGTHAMLEFPLQYAYFLLPFGLMVGSIQSSIGLKTIWNEKKWMNLILSAIAISMLSITVRDYFRAETSMYGLRFQHYKIQTTIPATPPDVLALTQFHDSILFARNTPKRYLKPEELQWMRDTVNAMPSPLLIYKLIVNLALNHHPEEAEHWIVILRKTSPEISFEDMRKLWDVSVLSMPELAAVKWPISMMPSPTNSQMHAQ